MFCSFFEFFFLLFRGLISEYGLVSKLSKLRTPYDSVRDEQNKNVRKPGQGAWRGGLRLDTTYPTTFYVHLTTRVGRKWARYNPSPCINTGVHHSTFIRRSCHPQVTQTNALGCVQKKELGLSATTAATTATNSKINQGHTRFANGWIGKTKL